MVNFIQTLNTTQANKKLLTEIFQKNAQNGISDLSERARILKVALSYLGFNYLRREELDQNTIDCSTLTSQSYWEGALLSIPFTADNQRSSRDGEEVQTSCLLPADIVVKYPDLESSPDKRWNHVGLILGETQGVFYVIESNSKEGCVISSLDKFDPKGGVKRYVKNENVLISEGEYKHLNEVSRKVPKLSRLGAKQYCKLTSDDRIIHKGVDIYTPADTLVKAPTCGILTYGKLTDENSDCAVIVNNDINIVCVLGNITMDVTLENKFVNKGQPIGWVTKSHELSRIDYPVLEKDTTHLHFQTHGNINLPFHVNKIKINDSTFYNGLYLAKMKIIDLPI